jgi:hypothetical protein
MSDYYGICKLWDNSAAHGIIKKIGVSGNTREETDMKGRAAIRRQPEEREYAGERCQGDM